MRLFTEYEKASNSLEKKKELWMNSICPFSTDDRLCGNWCALFFADHNSDSTKYYVILGCKGTDKQLYVDEVIS